jgi:hypothetical protein
VSRKWAYRDLEEFEIRNLVIPPNILEQEGAPKNQRESLSTGVALA